MEQRRYRVEIDPQALATFLVEHFDPQEDLQAQEIGQTGSHLVQIGRGDVPKDLRHAVTVAIARSDDGLTVTMGQQQWLDPKTATFSVAMGLLGLIVTPFALFGLLWPLSEALASSSIPGDVWNAVDTFLASAGGHLDRTDDLQHPHTSG